MKTPVHTKLAIGFVATAALGTAPGTADAFTLVVDPQRSTLGVTVTSVGVPFSPQVPGSLATSFGGTVSLDDLSDGLFRISGAEVIGLLNPVGPFLPSKGVGTIDNFGGTGTRVIGPNSATAFTAGRDLVFALDTTLLTLGGDAFAASQIRGSMVEGVIDFSIDYSFGLPRQTGSVPLAGREDTNRSPFNATFVVDADGNATLTLPLVFELTFDIFDEDNDPTTDDSVVGIFGTIVAAGVVPEPAAGLLVAGPVLLLTRRRR